MNLTTSLYKDLFEKELELLNNEKCSVCDANVKHPLLPWLVGDNFFHTKEKILFVGKPHRGIPGDLLPSGIIDASETVNGFDDLWNSGWAYWNYTRVIAEHIYNDAFNSIAMTNIIKCTNTDDVDATTITMANQCLSNLGVLWREVATIKPRNIIFYTYNLYPELLTSIPVAEINTIDEITPFEHKIPCGKKMLGWWERKCRTNWGETMRILVVGHPERMNKSEYVDNLVSWIKQS